MEGTKTSAKMNESTPSITQPSQQPRNPILCCAVNRERGTESIALKSLIKLIARPPAHFRFDV